MRTDGLKSNCEWFVTLLTWRGRKRKEVELVEEVPLNTCRSQTGPKRALPQRHPRVPPSLLSTLQALKPQPLQASIRACCLCPNIHNHFIAKHMCPRLHVVCQTNVVTWSWDRKYLNLNCTLTLWSGGQVCDLWLWYHHIRIVQYKFEYKHVTFNCWIYAEWWPIFTLILKSIQIYDCHHIMYLPTSCLVSFCLWVKGQNSQAHGPFIK